MSDLSAAPLAQYDEEAATRTFNHMWELAFGPEIERRQKAGTLPEPFALYIAQVIYPPEGESKVHLNEEVRGIGLMRAQRDVKAGDPIMIGDLAYVEKFDLPDELFDCGHFTIIRAGDRWHMFFNFLSGRKKAKDMLELASQFAIAAKESAKNDHAGPSIENLFHASELTSKAQLILNRDDAAKSRKHGPVHSAINKMAKTGNMDRAFVELFNRLGRQRSSATYADAEHRPPTPDIDSIELVESVIQWGLNRVARTTDKK